MSLAPPPEDLRAPTLELMVLQIQSHAQRHGYAVTEKRTKKRGSPLYVYKAWLYCDRSGEDRGTGGLGVRVYTGSRYIECPFLLTTTERHELDDEWVLEVKNGGQELVREKSSVRKDCVF